MNRPYPRYRDSAADWLGDVPEHWDVRRLKDVGHLIAGSAFPEALQGVAGEEFPFYKVADLDRSIDGQSMISSDHTISRDDSEAIRARVVPSGAIVYAKIGAALLLNRRRVTTAPACIDNNMSAFVPHPDAVSTEWALYSMSLLDFRCHVNPGAVPSLSEGDQAILSIPLPPLNEQRAIAAFLNRETERIDALVEKKQRLIERLREHRAALITRTVTRGLPPEAARAAGIAPSPRLKPSGVEWLGDVPDHWDVKALKWETPVLRGASPRPIDDDIYFDEDGSHAWVRISDVTAAGMYLNRTTQRLSQLGVSLSVPLKPGSLFLSIAGSVGKPCITNIECCIHDGFVYFPRWHGDVRYLFYVFASGEPYKGLGKLGTQLNLNTDTVGAIRLAVPPASEQVAVSTFLQEETATIDRSVDSITTAIERLREHRTALITAAVTGKIDVRDAAREPVAATI